MPNAAYLLDTPLVKKVINSIETTTFFVSRDVKFYETIFPFSNILIPPNQDSVLPNLSIDITNNMPLQHPFTINILSPKTQQFRPPKLHKIAFIAPTPTHPNYFPYWLRLDQLHLHFQQNQTNQLQPFQIHMNLSFLQCDVLLVLNNLQHGIKTTQCHLKPIILLQAQVLLQAPGILSPIFFHIPVFLLPIVPFQLTLQVTQILNLTLKLSLI